jgi:predicted deacylase
MPQSLFPALPVTMQPDYHGCRQRFHDSLVNSPRVLSRREVACPAPGPDGTELFTDVVWLGSDGAERVLVLISGTHGAEGFAGSAIQSDFLTQAGGHQWQPPANTAVLLIHALNPWGMAWCRRCDQDGIDLNRNFINFDQPPPANAGYLALRDTLMLEDATARATALRQYGERHGQTALEIAVSGGQFSDPAGPFFGGFGQSHARRLIEQLINDYALGERQLAVIDLHTGLGPYGYGEIICDHAPDSHGTRVAHQWYGDAVTLPLAGTSSSVPKLGLMDYGWHAIMDRHSCFVTLEFGTFGTEPLFDTILADHRLHAAGPVDWSSATCQQVKQRMARHFCPPDSQWQEMVLWRSRQVIRLALEGLQH